MGPNFYIADPNHKKAQRLLEHVQPGQIPKSFQGELLKGSIGILSGAMSLRIFKFTPSLDTLDIVLILILALCGVILICGSIAGFWLLRLERRDAQKVEQCLKEGSIIAVPAVIRAPFDAAARLPESKDSRPFWDANFFEVKSLLPLAPLLEDTKVSSDRQQEARSVIDREAAKAAARFAELEIAARDTKMCISDAEVDSLLAMYRKGDPT